VLRWIFSPSNSIFVCSFYFAFFSPLFFAPKIFFASLVVVVVLCHDAFVVAVGLLPRRHSVVISLRFIDKPTTNAQHKPAEKSTWP
jgi:hypothetical protein